jgi:hypothetical protein
VGAVLVLLLGLILPVATGASVKKASATTGSLEPQIAGSVAAPSASATTPSCELLDPSTELGPAVTPPAHPVTTLVSPPGGVWTFSATSSALYVLNGNGLYVYTLSGTLVARLAVPSAITTNMNNGASIGDNEISEPVVDPAGDIYLSSYYGGSVAAISPSGSLLWVAHPGGGNPTNIFAATSGSGQFELGVSTIQAPSSSYLYDAAGDQVGTASLWVSASGYTTQENNGDILYADGAGYVQTWDPSGQTEISEFGSPHIQGSAQYTGGPYQFFYPGQAVQGADGNIYTADGLSTIEQTAPDGVLDGSTTLGGSLSVEGGMFGEGDNLYLDSDSPFNPSSGTISVVAISSIDQYLSLPQAAPDTLGWGAGLSTPEAGEYFPAGTTPEVDADFAPWWLALASHFELSYSVWNQAAIDWSGPPPTTTIALPTSSASLASIPISIPAADEVPGPYQVEAQLLDTSTSPPTVVGSTCMPYTVGAVGDRLDLGALPSGIGAGGPDDVRGVDLNAQLGLNGLRGAGIDWSDFLPNCNSSAPTETTCGPAAMTFANAPLSFFQAAGLAQKDDVAYWVQVSGGDPTSTALVDNGWWQGDIEQLVSYYRNVPSGCGLCAPVTAWEPWNESNNTGWSDPTSYVDEVLKPFYAGVKAANPSATVIGGSTLGLPMWWWNGLISAGGLSYLDVAAVHPYTGNNDSWEEDGEVTQIRQLQSMLGTVPLWFTEIGWWSDGDFNYLEQANEVARAMIWQKVLGIPVWNYFFDEGNWGNDGVSFSLIQTSNRGDDYVKPAALATMTASKLLDGYHFVSTPPTNLPDTYQADFAPSGVGADDLAAVWTDGLYNMGALTVDAPTGGPVSVTVTSEYGNPTTYSLASGQAYQFPLHDTVAYVTYPAGDTLSLGPTEAYGEDLGLSANGASATASSGDASDALIDPTTTTSYGNGWTSAAGDTTPSITVTLPQVSTINRILVDTQSLGSTASGIRSYTVQVESPNSSWTTVGVVTSQFRDHYKQVLFPPVSAKAVKVTVTVINFGGYYGGGIPNFWIPNQPAPAFIHAIEIYSGSDQPAVDQGADLPVLGGPAPTPVTPPNPSPSGSSSSGSSPQGSPSAASAAAYWLVASNGGVFSFGGAAFYGSTGGVTLDKPIVGMAASPDGRGYWLVASDGGIFAFGDARFYGSTGGVTLDKPIVGMAATPDGRGYWLVASDGGIFSFGDADFYGSAGGDQLSQPIVGMISAAESTGYSLVDRNGLVFDFTTSKSIQALTGSTAPIVGGAHV